MDTAAQIIERFAGSLPEADKMDFERSILRHMEHHMQRAAEVEREACAKIIEMLPPSFGDLNRNDVAARIRNRT